MSEPVLREGAVYEVRARGAVVGVWLGQCWATLNESHGDRFIILQPASSVTALRQLPELTNIIDLLLLAEEATR